MFSGDQWKWDSKVWVGAGMRVHYMLCIEKVWGHSCERFRQLLYFYTNVASLKLG